MGAILQIQELDKSFGGVQVNKKVTFDVEEGRITSVIGPNGAGKTTLFNLVTGFLKPDGGKVCLDGKDITGLPPYKIVHSGISRTFQLVRVFPRLSVLDNIVRGHQNLAGDTLVSAIFQTPSTRRRYREKKEEAREMLEYVGLSQYEQSMASDLSYGQQKLVEIARALISKPKVLLLDEPLSGLNTVMIDKMLRLIDNIKADHKTVVIIEHNTEVVKNISDQITVLNFGEVISSGDPETVMNDPEVISSYLGVIHTAEK